jgi:dihydrofolate reductase
LDVLEVYEMPVMLGHGIPLFPKVDSPAYALKSIHAEMIAETVIKKTYLFK